MVDKSADRLTSFVFVAGSRNPKLETANKNTRHKAGCFYWLAPRAKRSAKLFQVQFQVLEDSAKEESSEWGVCFSLPQQKTSDVSVR